MGMGWAFATVKKKKKKQAGRLVRKDTVGKGTKAPDFSKGAFQGPYGINSWKIRNSFAANFRVPSSIRYRPLYLGRGGELEHFGKFESRHHAGTILRQREAKLFA